VFSNLKVNGHLQVYDDDASRWVQCVVKQVHSKTLRLEDTDGDHFTACRQTWLRSGPAIDRDTTKKREWRALQPVVPSKSARVIPTTGTLRRVSKSLEGSTAVQGGGSCLFVSHRSVESSEIENYYSP
jgi:hypothetical protein